MINNDCIYLSIYLPIDGRPRSFFPNPALLNLVIWEVSVYDSLHGVCIIKQGEVCIANESIIVEDEHFAPSENKSNPYPPYK